MYTFERAYYDALNDCEPAMTQWEDLGYVMVWYVQKSRTTCTIVLVLYFLGLGQVQMAACIYGRYGSISGHEKQSKQMQRTYTVYPMHGYSTAKSSL